MAATQATSPPPDSVVSGPESHRNAQGDEPRRERPTCSVWAAFDQMQLCYTVIPQVKHYYRYGTFRDCSEARADFNFCLKMKTKNRLDAEREMQEREDAKYDKKINERPSRDIWELRTEPPHNFPPA
ncbi:hypothetical protein HKX48_000791 [Thoreauomyces humboldtii]|nr:hypothetical protein HKX48_000791 [Thoreauomyces humboldtii]